jgi:hypothetical protein
MQQPESDLKFHYVDALLLSTEDDSPFISKSEDTFDEWISKSKFLHQRKAVDAKSIKPIDEGIIRSELATAGLFNTERNKETINQSEQTVAESELKKRPSWPLYLHQVNSGENTDIFYRISSEDDFLSISSSGTLRRRRRMVKIEH